MDNLLNKTTMFPPSCIAQMMSKRENFKKLNTCRSLQQQTVTHAVEYSKLSQLQCDMKFPRSTKMDHLRYKFPSMPTVQSMVTPSVACWSLDVRMQNALQFILQQNLYCLPLGHPLWGLNPLTLQRPELCRVEAEALRGSLGKMADVSGLLRDTEPIGCEHINREIDFKDLAHLIPEPRRVHNLTRQASRLETDPGKSCFLRPKGVCCRIPSSSGKLLFLRPSTDGMRPTPIMEGNLLHSVAPNLNVSLI